MIRLSIPRLSRDLMADDLFPRIRSGTSSWDSRRKRCKSAKAWCWDSIAGGAYIDFYVCVLSPPPRTSA